MDLYHQNKAYYDRNAERYEASSWYYFNKYKTDAVVAELKQCVRAVGDRKELRVLEIGPGTGYLLDKLLNIARANLLYTGIEHSTEMARILQQRFGAHCLKFEIVSASVGGPQVLGLPAATPYDLVLGSSILHHLPDYESVVGALAARLAVGGVMYFVREPIHIEECRPANRLVNSLETFYAGVNNFLMRPGIRNRLWPGKVKAEDASQIAIHMYKDGVSTAIFRQLARQNFRILFNRRYNRRVSWVFSYLENLWLAGLRKDIFGNTLFSIGLQKVAEG